ncbi:MAG: DMT family transporter [Candidatus Dormibacteraeota bacterium]|nr:DMT family transporter [Candidatus Dormibacteraeota bacterium]
MSIGISLAAALVYGAGDFLGGLASRRTALLTALLLSQGIGLAGIALIAALIGGDASGTDLLLGAAAGLAGGAGVAMLYRGLATGAMSLVAPITGVVAVVVPVAYGVARGERPAALQFAGIGLAIVAVTLLSASGAGRPRLARSTLLLALGSGVAFGTFYIAFARTSAAANLWPLLSARGASVAVLMLLALILRRPLRLGATPPAIVIGAGVCDVTANARYLIAVHGGLISIVAVIVSLYPVATVMCSVLFLGERLHTRQIAGVLTALGAVVLITAT